MFSFARRLIALLIAISVAGTLVMPGGVSRAEASVAMAGMTMGIGGDDRADCAAKSAMMAMCDASCAISAVTVLTGPAKLSGAVAACCFDAAQTTATGLAPAPARMPPRTTLRI